MGVIGMDTMVREKMTKDFHARYDRFPFAFSWEQWESWIGCLRGWLVGGAILDCRF